MVTSQVGQRWTCALCALLCGPISACASGHATQPAPVVPHEPEVVVEQPAAASTPSVAPAPAPPPGASLAADIVTTAPALLVKDGFASPESVLYDSEADVYLVSNLNGSPAAVDDNGFISRVSPDGKILALKWIDGAQDAVELNAPKGMAIVDGVLYVADLDRIRKFDVHTGAALGAIPVQGASFLNDVSASADGTLYFTDTGARASGESFERTGSDAVYKLDGDQARLVTRGKQLDQPNGVYADASGIWVVTFGGNELYNVSAGAKADVQQLPGGRLDGIVKANDGRLYVSSWEHNQIFAGTPGSPFQVAYEVNSPADIGYDAKRNWLLIPVMLENAVKLQPL